MSRTAVPKKQLSTSEPHSFGDIVARHSALISLVNMYNDLFSQLTFRNLSSPLLSQLLYLLLHVTLINNLGCIFFVLLHYLNYRGHYYICICFLIFNYHLNSLNFLVLSLQFRFRFVGYPLSSCLSFTRGLPILFPYLKC